MNWRAPPPGNPAPGDGDVESYADRKVAHVATFGALFVGKDAGLSRRASHPCAGGAMAESVSNRARAVSLMARCKSVSFIDELPRSHSELDCRTAFLLAKPRILVEWESVKESMCERRRMVWVKKCRPKAKHQILRKFNLLPSR